VLRAEHVALVSDAGTPAIADPGARLVRAAREHGIAVVPIPGPSAITAALSVAGLPLSEFTFMGFPPAGGSDRRTWFERLAAESRATVFFEAPHRIQRTLTQAYEYCGKRPILVFRELTKINEELVFQPKTYIASIKERGEFVLVVEPAQVSPDGQVTEEELIPDLIGRLTNHSQFGSDEIVRIVASVNGISERAAAKLIKKHKILVKQQNDRLA
jgi:16S rRNA (cytidine1402-2'-O)-methyltransferase